METPLPPLAPHILAIDDSQLNLLLLQNMLRDSPWQLSCYNSGREAIAVAVASPPDLILLDINMPDLDGFEVCAHMKRLPALHDVPIIFLSSLTDLNDKVAAFRVGGIDYITKPFHVEEVKARIGSHLKLRALQAELEVRNRHLQELVEAQVEKITEAQMATIFALAKLAEHRDTDTGRHLERVQAFCRVLAYALRADSPYAHRLDEHTIHNILLASPLHDIGKVAVPDRILHKAGKLDADEYALIKRHTLVGGDTLTSVLASHPDNAFVAIGIDMARSHHEWWDGSGYPDGLRGEAIPLAARIMAVADVYDALRSARSYKPAFDHATAVALIAQESGRQFDPVVVAAFLRCADELDAIHSENLGDDCARHD